MDTISSSKFIGSLSKFLQSLCNGYIDFDDGVELIGHIYLSVDGGKTGRTLNYFLHEKICKHDTLVTFISNSFHAQPECKGEGKKGDSKKDDEAGGARDSVPKSTNVGTVPSPAQLSRSATPHTMHRAGIQAGRKRPGSPLSALTSPSQRRMQSSTVKGSVGSPANIVPSYPSSSSQENVPSPSQEGKHTSEVSRPASNQSDNTTADNENDNVPLNVVSINPPPDFTSFLGSLTGENQSSQDQRSPPDVKPDTDNGTDVSLTSELIVSELSTCAQAGSAEQAETQEEEYFLVKFEVKRETDMIESIPSISMPTCQPQDSSLVKSECHLELDVAEEMPHSDVEHQTQDFCIWLPTSEKKRKYGREYSKSYRANVKNDAERYEAYCAKNKEKCKTYRSTLTKEKRQILREQARIRAQQYRARQKMLKNKAAPPSPPPPKPKTGESAAKQRQRERWRRDKQSERKRWTAQKWTQHKDQCAAYNRKRRDSLKKSITNETPEAITFCGSQPGNLDTPSTPQKLTSMHNVNSPSPTTAKRILQNMTP